MLSGEALHGENHTLLDNLQEVLENRPVAECGGVEQEKSGIGCLSLERIELAEKQKLRTQVRRLCQQNQWLRDELAGAQQRLQDMGQEVVTLEEQNRHSQFMSSICKYDQEEPPLDDNPMVVVRQQRPSREAMRWLCPSVNRPWRTWRSDHHAQHTDPGLQVLGTDHPDVAKQQNNLALLCQNQGKYQEVEKYYERALPEQAGPRRRQNQE